MKSTTVLTRPTGSQGNPRLLVASLILCDLTRSLLNPATAEAQDATFRPPLTPQTAEDPSAVGSFPAVV